MDLKGIVSASGKPGLYKLIGQNKSGFILETLDAQKNKLVANLSHTKLATLEDITIYGDGDEDIQLKDIFSTMQSIGNIPDPKKSSAADLKAFFNDVAPGHDEERVYVSDIKKIVSWYQILEPLGLLTAIAVDSEEQSEEK